MFKYSVYNAEMNLDELIILADRLKTCYIETGNILSVGDDFITWNCLEDIRSKIIENQKSILLMDTSMPFYDLEYHKEFLQRTTLLGVKYIRPVINDFNPAENPDLVSKLIDLCKISKTYGAKVLFENKADNAKLDVFFEEMYKTCSDEKPQFIFNPLEHVKNKRHPFFHIFYTSRLKNDIVILRINDGLFLNGEPMLPGEGNAEIKEMASILLCRSFDGWFSIGPYFGNSDLKLILSSFKNLLKEM